MALLSIGKPLDWSRARKHADHVRQNGIEQFLRLYRRLRSRQRDQLLWGDEVEYLLLRYDHSARTVRLLLQAPQILDKLVDEESRAAALSGNGVGSAWRPEYGSYMLEGTPGKPYGGGLRDLMRVERNMRERRETVRRLLGSDDALISMTAFPRMGAGDFLAIVADPDDQSESAVEERRRATSYDAAQSLFLPDAITHPHARFPTLTANIRQRRGEKVIINNPIFRDTKTPQPFIDPSIPKLRDRYPGDREALSAALPDHIYMDAMGFGMGQCCLQITFQACDIDEARRLYDQLSNVGPVMLALSAAAPVYRGYLADVDCRWNTIACSVDDRTPDERERPWLRSRYDTSNSYLSPESLSVTGGDGYNDLPLVYDQAIYERLRNDEGIDELLARHIAHLFIRDPIVIYEELIDQDNDKSTDHFENIQSTNWQTMRFKPPPPNSDIGWRVEFRPMEVQFTDFENAAYSVFIVLLTRAILSFNLNLLVPITRVLENMERAHQHDAVLYEKLYFRRDVFSSHKSSPTTDDDGSNSSSGGGGGTAPDSPDEMRDEYCEMSLNEIINGQSRSSQTTSPSDGDQLSGGDNSATLFPGLASLVEAYIGSLDADVATRESLHRYVRLIRMRAAGTLPTNAAWIRNFIREHPEYKQDSAVNEHITYDLIRAIERFDSTGFPGAPEQDYSSDAAAEVATAGPATPV